MTLIERSIVLMLVLGLLIGVGAVLRPFVTAILFGSILAIAAWPLREMLVRSGFGRGLVAALLLLLTVILIVLPIVLLAPTVVGQLGDAVQRIQTYFAAAPERPEWMLGLPLVGPRLERVWNQLTQAEGNLGVALAPYSERLRLMLLTAARGLAASAVQLALSLVVATLFWVRGGALSRGLQDILTRLGGPTAGGTLLAAAGAVRSVAYGVIGTAVVQAAILTLGLMLAGIPGAVALGFVGLLIALSQIGAPLLIVIWGGAAWYLFSHGDQGWGILMICWGVLVSTIDNLLKPFLIGLGVQMPMSLTLLGVFGGFVTFGFLGLFIGPTLIQISFVLLQAWRANAPAEEHPVSAEATIIEAAHE